MNEWEKKIYSQHIMESLSEEVYAETLEQPADIMLAILLHLLFIAAISIVPIVFPDHIYPQWQQGLVAWSFIGILAIMFFLKKDAMIMGVFRLYNLMSSIDVRLSPAGFIINKNGSFKKSWSTVRKIEIKHQEAKDKTMQRLITFYFSERRTITIEDAETWPKAKAIKENSDSIFEKVPVKVDRLDDHLSLLIPGVKLLNTK